MSDSCLNLSECFEEIPSTPGSQSVLCVEDFGEASPMVSGFCGRLNLDEYEEQGMTETEKALSGLIKHLETNPDIYTNVLRKKKKEEMETGGVYSLLKSRFMMKMQGSRYEQKLVSENEGKEKLDEMTSGMMMVYNYTKETHEGRRFSKRIADKKAKAAQQYKEKTPVKTSRNGKAKNVLPTVAPPPPPIPPPQIRLLQDRKNIMSSTPAMNRTVKLLKAHTKKRESTGSVQDELVTFDRVKRLKSTGQEKSPGLTPIKTPYRHLNASKDSLDWTLNSSEPLTAAFLRVMEQKFKNVRSPSPSNLSLDTSVPVSEFSP